MHIWCDADACPRAVKEVLFRAAKRTGVPLTLVANQPMQTPKLKHVRSVTVPAGLDVADHHIVQNCEAGDVVITADIPLAADVIAKGAHAIDPRGETHTPENIRERLSIRDFMTELRGAGVQTGGKAAWNQKDTQQFANALDRLLARR